MPQPGESAEDKVAYLRLVAQPSFGGGFWPPVPNIFLYRVALTMLSYLTCEYLVPLADLVCPVQLSYQERP